MVLFNGLLDWKVNERDVSMGDFLVLGLKKWWTSLEEMSMSTIWDMWSMRLI